MDDSTAFLNPLRQHRRKAGSDDFRLGFLDVILDPPEDDASFSHIINRIARAPIAISGLSDGPDIDEIFREIFHDDRLGSHFSHFVRFHIDPRHMGVTVEADRGELVGEI